jgi:hypothetical protein
MANRQQMQPDKTLMARLHAACRPSDNRSAEDMRATDSGDYLIENTETGTRRSTLGSSINYNPANA